MRFETARGGVLQRQVDIPADFLAFGHRLEHIVGDRRRIEIEQADPVEPFDLVQLAKQPGQRATLAAIDAVEGRVLRDQEQFTDAARGERSRFADDRFGRPAAIVAAQRRDDAEGARVITAFGDLDVRVVPRRRQQARGVGVVDVGRAGAADAGCGFGAFAATRLSPRIASTIGRTSRVPPNREPRTANRDGNRLKDLRHFAGAQHGVDFGDLRLAARRDSAPPGSR